MMNDRVKTVALWLVIIVTGLLLYYYFQSPRGIQPTPYSEFVVKVEAGLVERVTMMENQLQGVYKPSSGKNVKEPFQTYAPDDKELVPMLRKHNVIIVAKPADQNFWFSILISWGPIILLGVLWLFFMRQMQGAGSAAMSFGKSRAKLVSPNRSKITFQDVAGVDE